MAESTCQRIEDRYFTAVDLATVQRNVSHARAIMRTVMFAADAIDDGSMRIVIGGAPEGWCNAVGLAADRLREVRGTLIETVGSPHIDWVTPLSMVEAIEAALWHSDQRLVDEKSIECGELRDVAGVAVECLDKFAQQAASVEIRGVQQ